MPLSHLKLLLSTKKYHRNNHECARTIFRIFGRIILSIKIHTCAFCSNVITHETTFFGIRTFILCYWHTVDFINYSHRFLEYFSILFPTPLLSLGKIYVCTNSSYLNIYYNLFPLKRRACKRYIYSVITEKFDKTKNLDSVIFKSL